MQLVLTCNVGWSLSHLPADHLQVQGDDPELEAIRQRRMQEIMAQQGGQVCSRCQAWLVDVRVIRDSCCHVNLSVVSPNDMQEGWTDDRGATATTGRMMPTPAEAP